MEAFLVIVFVLAVVGLALFLTIKKLYWVSTPNEALIFSGATRLVGERRLGFRFVRGGRSIRKPLVERVDVMDLSMFTVVVNVTGAFTKGGIPLTIQGVANVKLPGEEPLLGNAVERFLGRKREDIYHVAKETLEGNLRGVLSSLTPEEVNEDKMRFAQTLLEEIGPVEPVQQLGHGRDVHRPRLRQNDEPVYYGQADRPEMLERVGAETAAVMLLTMDDPPEHHSQVTLSSHGQSLTVGSFLSPEERLDFAKALRAALKRANDPHSNHHPPCAPA